MLNHHSHERDTFHTTLSTTTTSSTITATVYSNQPDTLQMVQIIEPTRCNSFTSSLLDIYVRLNMFRVSPRLSSGAYNCARSLWFNRWRAVAGALVVVCQTTTDNAPAAVL